MALVNSGATRVLMHPDFVKHCNATMRLRSTLQEVRVIDDQTINFGLITHETNIDLIVDKRQEKLFADITNTGRYDSILSTPWLLRHDLTIRLSHRLPD